MPNLIARQLEVVREIALLRKLSVVKSLVDALEDDQRASLINIVENEWTKVRFKVGHLTPNKGDILSSKVEQRRQIRHTVRLMLGLDPVSQEEIDMAELDGTYGSVIGGTGKGGSSGGGGGAGEFAVFNASGTRTRGELSG